ncbi:16597_t:CDS:2, partial [Gigaspora margarita]
IDALIKDAPIKKATGPSQISNEMLKHIGPKVKQLDDPQVKEKNAIYPISKKSVFSGDLNQTRPITLIEH